jgi:hypothetical protein
MVLMQEPHASLLPDIKASNRKIERHPNLFVQLFFSGFEKSWPKEFAIGFKIARLRAALADRLLGISRLTPNEAVENTTGRGEGLRTTGIKVWRELPDRVSRRGDRNASEPPIGGRRGVGKQEPMREENEPGRAFRASC